MSIMMNFESESIFTDVAVFPGISSWADTRIVRDIVNARRPILTWIGETGIIFCEGNERNFFLLATFLSCKLFFPY